MRCRPPCRSKCGLIPHVSFVGLRASCCVCVCVCVVLSQLRTKQALLTAGPVFELEGQEGGFRNLGGSLSNGVQVEVSFFFVLKASQLVSFCTGGSKMM